MEHIMKKLGNYERFLMITLSAYVISEDHYILTSSDLLNKKFQCVYVC